MTRPAWYRGTLDTRARVSAYTVRYADMDFGIRVPAFQRPVVWSAAKQLACVRDLWAGLPMPPVVLWRNAGHVWVLDGLQRLTSVGAGLQSSDGAEIPRRRFGFDLATGVWSEHGDLQTSIVGLATMRISDVSEEGLYAVDHARALSLYVMDIEASREAIGPIFRALATPGVPWTEDELRALETGVGWGPGPS